MFDIILEAIVTIFGFICGILIITAPFWICWLIDEIL